LSVKFKSAGAADIYNELDTKAARAVVPALLRKVARRKLAVLALLTELNDLRVSPGNRLEALKGDRAGQHAIRLNDQYRICFVWTGTEAVDVEIVDYH